MGLLGGSWDLIPTYNWVFLTLLTIGITPIRPFRGVISRVIRTVIVGS